MKKTIEAIGRPREMLMKVIIELYSNTSSLKSLYRKSREFIFKFGNKMVYMKR